MSEEKIYNVPSEVAKRAWIDDNKYKEMYARSVKDPAAFQRALCDVVKREVKPETAARKYGLKD